MMTQAGIPAGEDYTILAAAQNLDFSRCREVPFAHQRIGTAALVVREYFGIFDEQGNGKTKQAIDAACFLFEMNLIDRVIVIAPNSVRGVWFDDTLGELAKHLWKGLPSTVNQFRQKTKVWNWASPKLGQRKLEWFVTNYEFIRSTARLKQLMPVANRRTLLICDESTAIKNHKSRQFKSTLILRNKCGRVVLLNGTPISNSPLDMWAQGQMMDKSILSPIATYTAFRAYFAIVHNATAFGGRTFPKITGWQNLDELQRRFAPHVVRRLKSECLDLPEKLAPVPVYVTLTPDSWKKYKEMRDELCVVLGSQVSTAAHAAIKIRRLSQITSGFLTGIEKLGVDLLDGLESEEPTGSVAMLGTEKIDGALEWIDRMVEAEPTAKLLIQTCHRPELNRLVQRLRGDTKYLQFDIAAIHGGQKDEERSKVKALLNPESANVSRPAIVVAITSTIRTGHNFTACHHVLRMARDYSWYDEAQSSDRVHRPGQVHTVNYYNLLAVGPSDQKTVDHNIDSALMSKEDVNLRTSAAWITALREE